MKKIALVAVLCWLSSIVFAAESLAIDFRYNTLADDGKNYVRWQTKDTKIKDSFDAASGASKAMTTTLLRDIQTADKKKVLPKGLYALLLFAVSSPEQGKNDSLTVVQQENQLTITFLHRGNAYKITTDGKRRLDPLTSFSIAEGLATNTERVFTIKDEFAQTEQTDDDTESKDENESSTVNEIPLNPQSADTYWQTVDWTKVRFSADKYDDSAEKIWGGKLKANFANGVLTIKGKLKNIDKPPEPEKPEPNPPETLPEQPTDSPEQPEAPVAEESPAST